MNEFEKNFNNLHELLKAKSSLTDEQKQVDDVSNKLCSLKLKINDEPQNAEGVLKELKDQYSVLINTLEPLEKIFGSNKDFKCVNKSGESKSIKQLIEGKSHLLL